MKHYLSIIMLLVSPLCAWSADGDTFVAQTPEGCSMTFTVISEQEKTACVGNEYDVAIDSETSGKVTIPSVANGYKVTRVSTRAFLLCNQLEEVVIPQGITSIGDLAFDSCEKLRHVNLPEGVKSIGQSAFAFCGELKSVTIPSTVTEFGLWIFLECRSLQEVHSLIQIPSPELPETFSANHPPQPDETMTRVGNHEDWELYNDATLYVPKGCKETYQQTEGWNLFAKIAEEAQLVRGGMSWIQEYSLGSSVSPEYRKSESRHFYFKQSEAPVDIGGHSCRMLYASLLGEEQNEHIIAALYEEDGRVYFYPYSGAEESCLLYDFQAKEGDELTVGTLDYEHDYEKERSVKMTLCKVAKVSEEDVAGVKRRCLYICEAFNVEGGATVYSKESDFCWIEGIGSTRGVEANISFDWYEGTPHQKLLECTYAGANGSDPSKIYDWEEFFNSTFVSDLDIPLSSGDQPLYDLSGRPASFPSKGIYIRNGKKVMVK